MRAAELAPSFRNGSALRFASIIRCGRALPGGQSGRYYALGDAPDGSTDEHEVQRRGGQGDGEELS